MISPRSIAVQGFASGALAVAMQGFALVSTPVPPDPVQPSPPRLQGKASHVTQERVALSNRDDQDLLEIINFIAFTVCQE